MICAQPRGFHNHNSLIFVHRFPFLKAPIYAIDHCSILDCVARSRINNGGWGPDNCRLPMVALAVFVQGEYSLRRQDMARYRRVPTRI